jgi:hypothetical protein
LSSLAWLKAATVPSANNAQSAAENSSDFIVMISLSCSDDIPSVFYQCEFIACTGSKQAFSASGKR